MSKWDVFISYAREDREPFVISLVSSLRRLGLSVWYDEFNISPGDSIRSSIDEGIAKSRFGIVILSKNYFGKKKFWTKVELDALFTQEAPNKKVILPVWHKLTFEQISKYSPIMASKDPLLSIDGPDVISQKIRMQVKPQVVLKIHNCKEETSVKIAPDLGIVFIEKTKNKEMDVYDYSGNKINMGRESPRINEGKYNAFEANFAKGDVILQVNNKVCNQSDIGKNIILNLGTNQDPKPFSPVYSCDAYSLGTYNSNIAEMLADLLKASKKSFKSNWRRIEIKEDSFEVLEDTFG